MSSPRFQNQKKKKKNLFYRDPHTNIGDSEYSGGMTSYCSAAAKTSDLQGELASNFWESVDYTTGKGVNGERYVQRVSLFSFFLLFFEPAPPSPLTPF